MTSATPYQNISYIILQPTASSRFVSLVKEYFGYVINLMNLIEGTRIERIFSLVIFAELINNVRASCFVERCVYSLHM